MLHRLLLVRSVFVGLGALLACGLFAPATSGAGPSGSAWLPLYKDASQPLEARVDDLLGRLTLPEKIALLHGDSKFTTPAIPRLGIPQRWFSDGPHGVREEVGPDTWAPAGRTDDFATYLPCGMALASTWDPEAARITGEVLGREARRRGKHVLLGPGVNILRTPLNGRTFEYLGEDPYLAGRLAVGYIQGLQSQKVAACVKHFALNNQETERATINVEVDERALREIYLPAFRAAVEEGGVWAVMGAYNKLRGQYCCHNDYLLNKILKGEWGFAGLVVSDWDGAHDTREAATNGLDVEMGTEVSSYDDYYMARPLLALVEKGELAAGLVDDKVRRSLRVMFRTGMFDGGPDGVQNAPEHQAAARRVAEEALVLLKNEGGLLPLQATALRSIAVIGANATRHQAQGGGSSGVKAFYEVTPLAGLIERAGPHVDVTYSVGYGRAPEAGRLERAVAAARAADVAIVVGGLTHDWGQDAEGVDRKDLRLPFGQDELVRRVAEANPRTIVVLVSGGPVEMDPWLTHVPAVIQAWYPGMEGGHALARLLFGDVNPSGKLPCTFPRRLADSPAHALGAYPGRDGTVRYEEGLLVGYRHFDTRQVEPLFPFGHGLSYTRFEYSNLRLVPGPTSAGDSAAPLVTVELDVANAGAREGAEVVQLYVRDVAASLPRPVQELKGFAKVRLAPGERQRVRLPLKADAFAFYDPTRRAWVAEKGEFRVAVGASSRDIRLEGTFRLAGERLAR